MSGAVLVGLVAALAGAAATFLVAARRFSGKIASSEASTLWEESREIRREYSARVERLEERVNRLEGLNDTLSQENYELRRQVEQQGRIIEQLQGELETLHAQKEALEEEVEDASPAS